ncbi:ABC transporter ATP-binding protein [Spirillospora sp. CA-142024]|uniref:ABC transporter ATP-binding protein n=1 Tax=Spirillospora sp. CA-142024 TaxID=3240036 RepID=UPI003D91A24A
MEIFDPAFAPEAATAPVPPAIRLDRLTRRYGRGRSAVEALRGVSADLPAGSFTAIMGPSGSGKSTLLQCAAGLDRPTSGRVLLGGDDLTAMGESRLTRLRRDRIGFVFQSFNLIPALTATENIILPLRLAGRRPDRAWLAELIERAGLAERAGHRPSEMSGGQQQRVAIARALLTRPAVVFGDEPTGALDLATGREILTLLREVVDTLGQTLVMVTHDPVAASYADRVLFLADGSIVEGMDRPTADRVAARLARLGG